MRTPLHAILLAAALILAGAPARAQMLDEVSVKVEGREAVANIRLNAQVQYVRHYPLREGSVLQIEFQVLGVDDARLVGAEDRRKVPAGGGMPGFTVEYSPQGSQFVKRLILRFDEPMQYRVQPGSGNRGFRIQMPLPGQGGAAPADGGETAAAAAAGAWPAEDARLAEAEPAPVIRSAEELERHAAELLARGRAAMDGGENVGAINTFNRLLMLPPNSHTREAQELVGVVRERNGELGKARAEYDLYLKLYPEGDGAVRVRQRLAALGPEKQEAPAAGKAAPQAGKPGAFTTTGGISQYYYRGASRVESRVPNVPAAETATFSGTDQSALVTNIDLNGQYRSEDYDHRLVFRDTNFQNFLKRGADINRVNAAYYEFKHLQDNFYGRIGRQSGLGGGVPGRFDGGLLGYALSSLARLNFVAGSPSELSMDSSRNFYGMSVDFNTFAENWSGSAFLINQNIDGISDRRATGGELRYFDQQSSAFAMLDYDMSYRKLNAGMLQGTYTTEGGYIWNMLYDHRLTPSLQTGNALIGEPSSSMHTLLSTFTESEVRERALARTALSRMLFLGLSKPLNATWQLGADVRMFNVGALPAWGDLPALPATGTMHQFDLQAIGTDLLGRSDVTVFGMGYTTGPTTKGTSLSVNNLSVVGDHWTVEPSLRLYRQRDNLDNVTNRVTPGLRLSYRVKERATLQFDGAIERSRVSGPTQNDNTLRKFFSLGYRIDF